MDKELAEPPRPPGSAGDNLHEDEGVPQEQVVSQIVASLSGLIRKRNFQDALEECDRALERYTDHEKLLEKKIKILCHQGRFEDAFSLASQWLQREPQHPIAIKELKRLKIVIEALNDQESDEETNTNPSQPSDTSPAFLSEAGRTTTPSSSSSPPQSSSSLVAAAIATSLKPDIPVVSQPMVSPTLPSASETTTPVDESLSCSFCEETFTSREELEIHCKSDSHKKNITSDEGHAWMYRPPPRGLVAEDYSLCQRFTENGRCPFAVKCTQAHSYEELEEWKERFKFRRQQIQMAKDKNLHGNTFPEQLLEKLMTAEYPKSVMVASVDYAKVIVNSDLKVSMMTKKCTNAWTFTLTSKVCILRVVLLDEASSNYFYISSISVGPKKTQKYQNLENCCQEWKNPDLTINKPGEYVYRVKVVFKTDIYGTFRQTLVFDFGSEPVLSREMQVESAPVTDTEKIMSEFKLSEQSRWRADNITVVDYKPKCSPEDAVSQALLFKYSLPPIEKFKFSEHLMQSPTKETYRLWMHQMLYVEELAQLEKIAKFNVTTSLQLVNRFLLVPGALSAAKFAQDGELFARMKLEDDLSIDSVEGRLIFQNANSVWIAPHKSNRKPNEHPSKVYEALVEDRGKNFVFLRLSEQCVTELELTCDQEFMVEVQFQLNRLPVCEMHSAVDALPTLDLVFPKVGELNDLPLPENWEWKEEIDKKTNSNQKEAIMRVAAYSNLKLPPVLIVGPFGTGKTYTLAQGVKQVLQNPGSKTLICTHSNSAADLYIKDFLHPYVMEGNLEARPLRVLYRYRWIQTVPETVLQYCIQETMGTQTGTFRVPTREDLDKHRIVITTLSTARLLSDLNLPTGYFTHIFLDEAAQALECETLIPLSLAGPNTRVVLAGDHMQMSPDVFSNFGEQQEFQKSLLERLFDMYPDSSPCKIMLCENYRSNLAIVEFTSELFYDNKLTASLDPAAHGVYYPLTFFTARGEETQHENSSGYFNTAEIYEVVEQVEHLHKHWPPAWGEFDENSICVVAPYTDQVIRIRSELRKRKMFKISVERVVNIQGKQFRVIMLSTVRTRHTCSTEGMEKLDLGFLSNIKLLNTAITRAQSHVVVVGDPVSLCLVGKCSKVWEYYLEVCNAHDSFFGMTWPHLRSLLNNVEMTKTYILNPLAPEFVPKSIFSNAHQGQPVFMAPGHPAGNPVVSHYPGQRSFVGPAHYQQVYQQAYVPMMYPYHPYYGPGPVVYRPNSAFYPRQSSPHHHGKGPHRGAGVRYATAVRGRGTPIHVPIVPKEEVERTSSESPRGDSPVPGKKGQPKARIMYVPRVPVPSPYYPYPQYIPVEDPRYAAMAVQPPYFYNYGPIPRPYVLQQVHPQPRPGSGTVSPASSTEGASRTSQQISPDIGVSAGRQSAEERYSPALSPSSTTSGQQIQLLPNVKHVPLHLLNNPSGSEENSRSSTPGHTTSPSPHSPLGRTRESPRSFPTEPENYRKRHHSGPRPVSQSPSYSSQSSHESSVSPVLNGDSTVQQTTVTETQPATVTKRQLKLNATGLKLNTTGFSRQFSDELGTPTEITNLVRMIEENIEEGDEEEVVRVTEQRFQVNTQSDMKPAPPAGKLYLNLTAPPPAPPSQPSSGSSEGDDMGIMYAGALRHQLPLAREINQIDPSMLEPQTPMTPAGFITPGTDMAEDPLEILRNLHIDNDTLNKSAHGHF